MPQFSLLLVTSQVFWLVICFLVLYFFVSRVFLPRVSRIMQVRKEAIDKDTLTACDLQKKIDQVSQNSNTLRDSSVSQYQTSIDQANKQTILDRENSLNKLKKKIDKMMIDSEQRIGHFIKDSKSDCELAIKNLVQNIGKKVLNKKLNNDEVIVLTNYKDK